MISFGIEFHNLGAVAENDQSKNDVLDLGTAKEPLDADRRLRLSRTLFFCIHSYFCRRNPLLGFGLRLL